MNEVDANEEHSVKVTEEAEKETEGSEIIPETTESFEHHVTPTQEDNYEMKIEEPLEIEDLIENETKEEIEEPAELIEEVSETEDVVTENTDSVSASEKTTESFQETPETIVPSVTEVDKNGDIAENSTEAETDKSAEVVEEIVVPEVVIAGTVENTSRDTLSPDSELIINQFENLANVVNPTENQEMLNSSISSIAPSGNIFPFNSIS